MTLEEFKECFGDCSTIKKLDLLIENMEYLADDRENRVRAELRGDRKGEMYYGMEEFRMMERVVWLYREICRALETEDADAPWGDGERGDADAPWGVPTGNGEGTTGGRHIWRPYGDDGNGGETNGGV